MSSVYVSMPRRIFEKSEIMGTEYNIKIQERMNALHRVLALICDIDKAQMHGQHGLEDFRINVMDDARAFLLPMDTARLNGLLVDFQAYEKEFEEMTNFKDDEIGRAAKILREAGEQGIAAKLLKIGKRLESDHE